VNKDELVQRLSERAGVSSETSRQAVNAFVEEVTLGLLRGDKITLQGFGTFTVAHREAYIGRNPRTGKPVPVPSRLSPVFRAGGTLKRAILDHPLALPPEAGDGED
jgi:nucleoid DNA-binding protein